MSDALELKPLIGNLYTNAYPDSCKRIFLLFCYELFSVRERRYRIALSLSLTESVRRISVSTTLECNQITAGTGGSALTLCIICHMVNDHVARYRKPQRKSDTDQACTQTDDKGSALNTCRDIPLDAPIA